MNAIAQLQQVLPSSIAGTVVRCAGLTVAVADFPAPVGALAQIRRISGEPIPAEVIGFHDELTLLFPLADMAGVRHGDRVEMTKTTRWLPMGQNLLGRVIDATGRAIDGLPQPLLRERVRLDRPAPAPLERPRIDEPLSTGVRAIDALLTCGKGQRVGIFSGSGVGKSVTLGMMARYSSADVIVVALVDERGREVMEFLERDLGAEGRARSVVVVATSDEPALMRVHAASTATAVAEYFRDQGRDVLLLFDSLTRFALAQREIGLAAGEPPTTRGYPPSVFAMLPKLVERTGRTRLGSITAFYTVLVEGDDPNEPISDTVRGLLDGHTWLSRKLASHGHYPAVDVLQSVSRLMPQVTDAAHQAAAAAVRSCLAVHREHEDFLTIGAYRPGANPQLDTAIAAQESILSLLRQSVEETSTVVSARNHLLCVHDQIRVAAAPRAA